MKKSEGQSLILLFSPFLEVSNGVTSTDEHLYPENGYDIGQYK